MCVRAYVYAYVYVYVCMSRMHRCAYEYSPTCPDHILLIIPSCLPIHTFTSRKPHIQTDIVVPWPPSLQASDQAGAPECPCISNSSAIYEQLRTVLVAALLIIKTSDVWDDHLLNLVVQVIPTLL